MDSYYNREFVDGGELSMDEAGNVINIEDTDGEITPGYVFSFTPEQSGTYTIYSQISVDTSAIGSGIDPTAIGTDAASLVVDPMAFLEVEGDTTWKVFDDNGGTLTNFKITFECEEGVTYIIKTGLTNPEATGTYTVYVSREKTHEEQSANYSRTFVDGGALSTEGLTGTKVEITDENGYDFTFTPASSGKYRFTSVSTKQAFAYLEAEGAETWAEYSEGETLNNFSIEYDCEAGVTYHLKTGFVDDTQTGNYRILVTAVNS